MNLKPGTRLGPYEILALLGAGGMGEVYRARDSRLGRSVAIKILPAEFSSNARLRVRFEREAKAISSLAHPHICTVHDVGRENGTDYLVMEYLEGETLAQKLERGALPLDQVLRYGIQIAEALEQAHRHGIVHRDLKPSNIMVTKSGAKLLDFGLAKSQPAVVWTESKASHSPTVEKDLTGVGHVVGTVAYMSPEQVEGKEADARSDIFALGVILFQMATGRRAFSGDSAASVIAAILKEQPPSLQSLVPLAPLGLDHAIRAALAKDPDERIQTAHDIALQLRWITDADHKLIPRRSRHVKTIGFLAASLGVLATLTFLFIKQQRPAAPPLEIRRLSLMIPRPRLLSNRFEDTFAISRDGKYVVYAGRSPVGTETAGLYLQSLDSTTPQKIADGAGLDPFFSPDGKWIAFVKGGKLQKVPVTGGPPVSLCPVQRIFGRLIPKDPDSVHYLTRYML